MGDRGHSSLMWVVMGAGAESLKVRGVKWGLSAFCHDVGSWDVKGPWMNVGFSHFISCACANLHAV